MKSEYLYLQYHWCPVAFNVTDGLWISPIKYKNLSEGVAIEIKMIAGEKVHTVSIICLYNVNWFICLLKLMSLLYVILTLKLLQ